MNNFIASQSPDDPRRADRPCPFAGTFEQLGVGSGATPPWMQAHLTECLWCLNDFTRLQSLGAGRARVEDGRRPLAQLGAFMLERKSLWLPIVVILALFGGLLVTTQGSAVAPFIYALW
jgi:hypothetical protein